MNRPTAKFFASKGALRVRAGCLLAGAVLGAAFLGWGGAGLAWVFLGVLGVGVRLFGMGFGNFLWVGLGIQLTVFHWLPGSIGHYGGFSAPVSMLLGALFVMVGALRIGVAGWLASRLERIFGRARFLALPLGWLTAECLMPGIIPWRLAHTQIDVPILASSADLLGVPLLSALMLLWSQAAVALVTDFRSLRGPECAVTAISLLLVLGYHQHRSATLAAAEDQSQTISVGLIQPNFDPAMDFRPEMLDSAIQRERELSLKLLRNQSIDLLAWPESSVWFDLPDRTKGFRRAAPNNPFAGFGVPVLFGGESSISGLGSASAKPALRNSVFLVNPEGVIAGRYHKRILVPFSEHIPLQEYFPALEQLNRKDYFIPSGEATQPIIKLLLGSNASVREMPIGTAICYEDLFPEAFHDQVSRQGAELLFSLSNDAWFRRSAAGRQHFLLARWNAVLFRRFLVRVTMDGVSAVVDPNGAIADELPDFTAGSIVSRSARPLRTLSLYARCGDLPLQILSLIVLLCGLVFPIRRNKLHHRFAPPHEHSHAAVRDSLSSNDRRGSSERRHSRG